jgi:hypothetical protein
VQKGKDSSASGAASRAAFIAQDRPENSRFLLDNQAAAA